MFHKHVFLVILCHLVKSMYPKICGNLVLLIYFKISRYIFVIVCASSPPNKSAEEKIRFLETQNKKLAAELESVKSLLVKGRSAVKTMYEVELAEARKLIDDLTKVKTDLENKNLTLHEKMKDNQKL